MKYHIKIQYSWKKVRKYISDESDINADFGRDLLRHFLISTLIKFDFILNILQNPAYVYFLMMVYNITKYCEHGRKIL